ncbi:MAG: type II toxin-antitoxin system VapC family toxin, partial [Nitrosospira sp.]|nr:type II toxin-antitoxin system VapC family toxin [Nitrosospira sp.]
RRYRASRAGCRVSQILVVDAAVVVDLLARFRPQPIEELLWVPGTILAAPELLDIEVLNALRKLDLTGAIPSSRKADLPRLLQALRIRKYRHANLLDGIWPLRKNLTAYDAAYVVLAKLLDATLVTRDTRLANAPGLPVKALTP